MEGFECTQCGKCCLVLTEIEVIPEDFQRWKEQGREDIIQQFDVPLGDDMYDFTKEARPEVQEKLKSENNPLLNKSHCQNLSLKEGKYICLIHETKPRFCRGFPFSKKHALEFSDCEGVKKLL